MYEIYYVKLQTVHDVSNKEFVQLKKFYKMNRWKDVWHNPDKTVWMWRKENENDTVRKNY